MSDIQTDPVVLYLLMRTDLASMNPGKACAQAHHAATQMAHTPLTGDKHTLYQEWLAQTGAYGTVLTLAVDYADLQEKVLQAFDNGHPSGTVLDPTYPLNDGEWTHYIPLITCGYVLARKSKAFFLDDLSLMP